MKRRGMLKAVLGAAGLATATMAGAQVAAAPVLPARESVDVPHTPFGMPRHLVWDHPFIIYNWSVDELTWLDEHLTARGDVFVVRGIRVTRYPTVVVYAQLWDAHLGANGQRGTYEAELTYSLDDAWREMSVRSYLAMISHSVETMPEK